MVQMWFGEDGRTPELHVMAIFHSMDHGPWIVSASPRHQITQDPNRAVANSSSPSCTVAGGQNLGRARNVGYWTWTGLAPGHPQSA